MSRFRRAPVTVYLMMAVFGSMAFPTVATMSIIYQVTQANPDPFQLLLAGTGPEGTVFLFEVPTGVVADSYSREVSLVLGFVLIGAGFIIEGALPIFWMERTLRVEARGVPRVTLSVINALTADASPRAD